MKNIASNERLIFALDVPEIDDAKKLIKQLGDNISFYKIGMELLMTGQYFELIDYLLKKNKKVFVDLKFFDVPKTVERTIARLSNYDVFFATIHGNQQLMESANKVKGGLKILAVTALTSLDRADLNDLGFNCNITDLVVSRAKRAFEAGCDGIISSGLEITKLRKLINNKLIIVVPGIRPVDNCVDDQKRTINVHDALANGADYLVIGRPIRDAINPALKAQQIQQEIDNFFHTKQFKHNLLQQ